MYSRSDLKEMGQAYGDAVKEPEITLFTRYIADGVITYAKKGVTSIRFPILEKKVNIAHGFDGLLNKHDPGPIPITYMYDILCRLQELFPDIDLVVEEKHLLISWT
jgi:hypothetical protein